jgi:hypothetical protein
VNSGQSDLNLAIHAAQSHVAARQNGPRRIALYHNIPAAWHRRAEAAQALTEELRQSI